MEADVTDVKEQLTQSLFDHIPVGVGSQGIIPTSAKDLEAALEMGLDWSLREVRCSRALGCSMRERELLGPSSPRQQRRGDAVVWCAVLLTTVVTTYHLKVLHDHLQGCAWAEHKEHQDEDHGRMCFVHCCSANN